MGRNKPPHLNEPTMSGYDFTYDMYISPYDYSGSANAFEISSEIEELEEWNSDLR